mmetsp:Transcript_21702/g.15997  ORF Transcript_21702/g.15997 Transcript_21702/m.15997 type:complete len:89 (-) Transcript_21702:619-885(-)
MRVTQNIFPRDFNMLIVKWQSLYMPFVGPQNEHSNVNELIRLNSFHITTLAVASLVFCTTKLQLLKEKCSVFLWKSIGNILSLSLSAF